MLNTEVLQKQKKTRRNSNERFTEMCKGRKKNNPIRGKMVKLDLIKLKKLKKEVGRRKTEPRPHKGNKKNRLVWSGRRNYVFTWEFETRKELLLDQAMRNQQVQFRRLRRWLGELLLHPPHDNKIQVLNLLQSLFFVNKLALTLLHHQSKAISSSRDKEGT